MPSNSHLVTLNKDDMRPVLIGSLGLPRSVLFVRARRRAEASYWFAVIFYFLWFNSSLKKHLFQILLSHVKTKHYILLSTVILSLSST